MPCRDLAGHKEPVCVPEARVNRARKCRFAERGAGSNPVVYLHTEVWEGADMEL